MSEGHWRAIVSGSRSMGVGNWVPVRGPATTLARMAQAVGVTADQLEDAGRADAAAELKQVFLTDSVTASDHLDVEKTDSPVEAQVWREIRRRIEADPELARLVLEILKYGGPPGPGEPGEPDEDIDQRRDAG